MRLACTHSKINQYLPIDIFSLCCIFSLSWCSQMRLEWASEDNFTNALWNKKTFALVKCQCEIEPMNKQTYALRVKLASLKDAKKISVLKLKIQKIEKSKSWTIQLMNTQYRIQLASFIEVQHMETLETGQTLNGTFSNTHKKHGLMSKLARFRKPSTLSFAIWNSQMRGMFNPSRFSLLMNKLSSSYQYNLAKNRFFGLLLVLSTIGAILIFILLWQKINSKLKTAI